MTVIMAAVTNLSTIISPGVGVAARAQSDSAA